MNNKISNLGVLPSSGYVRQSQLIPNILPFSAATLWRKVRDGSFPTPVKLSVRITAWKVEDIKDWMIRVQQSVKVRDDGQ
jgi:predicted DNA-binding transcriptional regulator AlpA